MCESMGSELQSRDHLREVYGRGRAGGYREENGRSLNPLSTSFAAIANKSARTPARGKPRGCRPACHTASAPRPTAGGPIHSRARCDAWRATARYAAPAVRAESPSRRSRDPRAHSPAAAAVAPVRRAAGNRIDQRQGSLRVVPVRAGQANRERQHLIWRSSMKSHSASLLAVCFHSAK